MVTVTKHYCDKCHKEIDGLQSRVLKVTIKGWAKDAIWVFHCLCQKCHDELKWALTEALSSISETVYNDKFDKWVSSIDGRQDSEEKG